jgi:enoyl-[acyl-carrier protein] reductase III
MTEGAATLTDELLPVAPYRQWVFSFPYKLRVHLAYNKELLSKVLAICMRKVFAFQRKAARRLGIPSHSAAPLAVLLIQRFGSLLQLNPHGHAVFPDGVFVLDDAGEVRLLELPPPTRGDLEALGLSIVGAIFRLLERRAGDPDDADPEDAPMMQALSEAASSKPRRPRCEPGDHSPSTGGDKLAAQIRTELGVLSLHAETKVAACDRRGLERLLRYGARPAFAHERLSFTDSGKISYRLRKPYIAELCRLIDQEFGKLDILVANAGGGGFKTIMEVNAREFDYAMHLNVRSLIQLVQAAFPLLEKSTLERSKIITITSLGGTRAMPMYGLPGTAKGALESLTRQLAFELGPRGVNVNCVCAGLVKTASAMKLPAIEEKLAARRQRSLVGDRDLLPEHVANAVVCVASPLLDMMQGQTLRVDRGISIQT